MLNFISAGMSIAGGIMGASSAKRQARAQAKAAREQAKYNADILEQEAESIYNIMDIESERLYRQKRKSQGEQAVALGKSGATMSGTALKVALENSANMQKDILIQRSNRLTEASSKKQQGKRSIYEGEVSAQTARMKGKAAARSSLLGGFTSSIGSLGAGLSASKSKDGGFGNFSIFN